MNIFFKKKEIILSQPNRRGEIVARGLAGPPTTRTGGRRGSSGESRGHVRRHFDHPADWAAVVVPLFFFLKKKPALLCSGSEIEVEEMDPASPTRHGLSYASPACFAPSASIGNGYGARPDRCTVLTSTFLTNICKT